MNVFITSPSRVGSNWLCDILTDLLKPITLLRLYSMKHLLTPKHKIPIELIKKLDSMKGNNIFKVHIWKPEELVNIVSGSVIGLVRNYDDSVNSLLNWIKNTSGIKISIDELKEQRKEQLKRHRQMYDSMNFDHKKYRLYHYEDLKNNAINTIQSICGFLKIQRSIESSIRMVQKI